MNQDYYAGLAYNGTTYPLTMINQFYFGENRKNCSSTTNMETFNGGRLGALNPFTWTTSQYAMFSFEYEI